MDPWLGVGDTAGLGVDEGDEAGAFGIPGVIAALPGHPLRASGSVKVQQDTENSY